MSDLDPNGFSTASPTLSPDDPLRDVSAQDWIAKVKADHPDIAGKLLTDPVAAVNALANRGVPPPPSMPSSASGYFDIGDPNPTDDPTLNTPFRGAKTQTRTMTPPPPPPSAPGVPDPTADQGPYVFNKPRTATPPDSTPPPLDPTVGPTAPSSGTTPTDVSAAKKKKPEDDSGMGDFAKSLAGIKALQPPPNAAVGTPSVHGALAMKTPDITQLLASIGAQSRPTPLDTLGRLLVAGKA